jgi:hypothetical protein
MSLLLHSSGCLHVAVALVLLNSCSKILWIVPHAARATQRKRAMIRGLCATYRCCKTDRVLEGV